MKFETGETVKRHGDIAPYRVEWDHPDGRVSISTDRPGDLQTIEPDLLAYRHPSLQFFKFSHLPEHLQEVSKPFHRLAHHLAFSLSPNDQLTVALQHLIEAKDAAVRARIFE